jgi:hypothetical protein
VFPFRSFTDNTDNLRCRATISDADEGKTGQRAQSGASPAPAGDFSWTFQPSCHSLGIANRERFSNEVARFGR